ncbi:MAG: hypothetical protein ACLRSU_09325 [Thomasclavelia spiroformis]|uniref:hypothetical protein n=1 Tax=Thomasclavelia spiroformis TaxID=29348 RepID=UPI003990D461
MNINDIQYRIIKTIVDQITSYKEGYKYFAPILCMSPSNISKYKSSKFPKKFGNFNIMLENIDKEIGKGNDIKLYQNILKDINSFLLAENLIKKPNEISHFVQLKEIKTNVKDDPFAIIMLYLEKYLSKYKSMYTISFHHEEFFYIDIAHSILKQYDSFSIFFLDDLNGLEIFEKIEEKQSKREILILNFSSFKKTNFPIINKQRVMIENLNILKDKLKNNSFQYVANECSKLIDRYMVGFNQYLINQILINQNIFENLVSKNSSNNLSQFLIETMNYLSYHEYVFEKNLIHNLSNSSSTALFIDSFQTLDLIFFCNKFKIIILAISNPSLKTRIKNYLKKHKEHFNNIKIIQFNGTIDSLNHQMYLLYKNLKIDLLYVGQGSASLLDFSKDSCAKIAGLLSDKGKIILSFLNKDSQIINSTFYNKESMTIHYDFFNNKFIFALINANNLKLEKELSNFFTIKNKYAYPFLGTLYNRNHADKDLRKQLRTVDKLLANISLNQNKSDSKETALINKLIELNNVFSAFQILYAKKPIIRKNKYEIADLNNIIKKIEKYRIIKHEPFYSSYKLYKYLEVSECKPITLIKVIIFKTKKQFVYYLTTNVHNLKEQEIETIRKKYGFENLSIAPRKEVLKIHYNHPITPLFALSNNNYSYIYNINELKNIVEEEIYCSFNELNTICINKKEFIEKLETCRSKS